MGAGGGGALSLPAHGGLARAAVLGGGVAKRHAGHGGLDAGVAGQMRGRGGGGGGGGGGGFGWICPAGGAGCGGSV